MHEDGGGGVAQGGGQLVSARHHPLLASAIDRNRLPQMCGANPFAPDFFGEFAEASLVLMEETT